MAYQHPVAAVVIAILVFWGVIVGLPAVFYLLAMIW